MKKKTPSSENFKNKNVFNLIFAFVNQRFFSILLSSLDVINIFFNLKVTKVIPDCGHKIKVQCKDIATRELCTEKCGRKLPCGHPCRGLCKNECDVNSCTMKTGQEYISPCSHTVRLPCNVKRLAVTGKFIIIAFLYNKYGNKRRELAGH